MAENRPWLRTLLIVLLAAVVLATVAGAAYKLGQRHAGTYNPAIARLDNEALRHPFGSRGGSGFGLYADGGEERERGFVFSMGTRELGRSHMRGLPLAHLGMLLIGATLFGMLVLGTIAFFRTGGWRPAMASATQSSRRKRS